MFFINRHKKKLNFKLHTSISAYAIVRKFNTLLYGIGMSLLLI